MGTTHEKPLDADTSSGWGNLPKPQPGASSQTAPGAVQLLGL